MLTHPTLEKLEALRLFGMLSALNEQRQMPECSKLSFEERLGLLVDREATVRDDRRLALRLKQARLRQSAAPEDVDFRHPRGLDRAQFMALVSCQWIRDRNNLFLTGPTGVGKTYLACAFAQKACREGYTVLYTRTNRLLQEIAIARADGTYNRRLAALARQDLLVMDDWGIAPLGDEQRRDLLEILDDRYDRHSTLIAAQLPVENWHEHINDPTLADAILDRLVHNAHKVDLKGESMRKRKSAGTTSSAEEN
ncbi:MAG: ATP-binding protein [Gemmatimonadaceae bacterium]|nr:ATP-binding protein [Gemmatimonadaceae bacterium]